MQFTDILGLPDIKEHLIQSVEREEVAHAQLFLGPEGSANLALALAYARFLNCDNRRPDGSCADARGSKSSTGSDQYIHPDLHFVFPVCSTKKITGKDVVSDSFITEWRAFLAEHPYGTLAEWSQYLGAENKALNISKEESRNIIRKLSLTAFNSRYKIVIIWHPECMHPAAANGILKILEEPPERTLFLLVAHSTEQLLPTIISRTQIVTIRAFHDDEIVRILAEKGGDSVDYQRLQRIATLAEGNLQRALQVYNDIEDDSHQLFREWMRLCYVQEYKKLLPFVDNFHKQSKETQKTLFDYGLALIREILVHQSVNHLTDYDLEDTVHKEKSLIRSQGKDLDFVVNFSKVVDISALEKMTALFNDAYHHLERNASPKIVLLDTSLQLGRLMKRI